MRWDMEFKVDWHHKKRCAKALEEEEERTEEKDFIIIEGVYRIAYMQERKKKKIEK